MKRAKQLFMTYRNGIIADSLRKAGMPYSIIFGLQLPQIKQIASQLAGSLSEDELVNLSEALHADRNVRESRLLAMALYPPSRMTMGKAREWLEDLLTREEADLLPFLLLRRTPYLKTLLEDPAEPSGDLGKYAREALARFT